ncbi:hypothetical protein M885DRAFT_567182 [Pelagophyceae sp. CCMP2097]|nr:hypothetical protein M885DRAFT_567182 [Pelagophyceae sp. CCMP2097]
MAAFSLLYDVAVHVYERSGCGDSWYKRISRFDARSYAKTPQPAAGAGRRSFVAVLYVGGDNNNLDRNHYDALVAHDDPVELDASAVPGAAPVANGESTAIVDDGGDPNKDAHVFSSHFYTKFYEKAIGLTQDPKDAACDRAIICHPGLLFDELIRIEEDDDGDAAPERSCIIFLDSLGMHNSVKRAKVLGELAEAPVLSKHLPFVTLKVLEQKSGYDCGLYLLRYFEELLPLLISSDAANAPALKVTSAAIKSKFASNIFENWFTARDIAGMRVELATTIRWVEERITGKPSCMALLDADSGSLFCKSLLDLRGQFSRLSDAESPLTIAAGSAPAASTKTPPKRPRLDP